MSVVRARPNVASHPWHPAIPPRKSQNTIVRTTEISKYELRGYGWVSCRGEIGRSVSPLASSNPSPQTPQKPSSKLQKMSKYERVGVDGKLVGVRPDVASRPWHPDRGLGNRNRERIKSEFPCGAFEPASRSSRIPVWCRASKVPTSRHPGPWTRHPCPGPCTWHPWPPAGSSEPSGPPAPPSPWLSSQPSRPRSSPP